MLVSRRGKKRGKGPTPAFYYKIPGVYGATFIHSFIHSSNCFIQVRVVVDTEFIPGPMNRRQEYTLDGMPVHLRVPCTHNHLNLWEISILQSNYQHVCGRCEETYVMAKLHAHLVRVLIVLSLDLLLSLTGQCISLVNL